jgi:hypothetical protein
MTASEDVVLTVRRDVQQDAELSNLSWQGRSASLSEWPQAANFHIAATTSFSL